MNREYSSDVVYQGKGVQYALDRWVLSSALTPRVKVSINLDLETTVLFISSVITRT